jgi:transposase
MRFCLLPAQYARAYVRRNKTDAADAAALIEAARCPDIRPVPIKFGRSAGAAAAASVALCSG